MLGLALISLGYAYLTANLKVTGTAKIGNKSFNVVFKNPQMIAASDTATFDSNSNSNIAAGTPVVTSNANGVEVEWNVTFNQPGDFYEFVVDLENEGDIDAVEDIAQRTLKVQIDNGTEYEIDLDDFDNDEHWPSYLHYHNDYLDDTSANNWIPYYLIPTGDVRMHFEVELDPNVDAETWEAIRGKSIKITSGYTFIQGDGLPEEPSNSNSNGD